MNSIETQWGERKLDKPELKWLLFLVHGVDFWKEIGKFMTQSVSRTYHDFVSVNTNFHTEYMF